MTATKASVWPLILALTTAAVSAAGAQPPPRTTEIGGSLNAALDKSFSLNLVEATSSPVAAPYMSFTVCQDRIFAVRDSKPGSPARTYEFLLRPEQVRGGMSVEPGSADLFPSRAPLAMSLGGMPGRVGFYDTEAHQLVVFDPSGAVEEIPAGRSLITGFGQFQNGNLIVVSRTMKPTPLESYEELATGDAEEELEAVVDHSYSLGDHDLFLTDAQLHVIQPLASRLRIEGLEAAGEGHGGWLERTGPDLAEKILGRRNVRLNESGTLAAVFSVHQPGIAIYSQEGELVAELVHPGRGRKLEADEAFARLAPAGTDVFFQTDVAFWGQLLLVVDPSARTVWEVPLDGAPAAGQGGPGESHLLPRKPRRGHRLPYEPMHLEIGEEGLFILDSEGNLRRYELIWN
jgi:hypothetical protein